MMRARLLRHLASCLLRVVVAIGLDTGLAAETGGASTNSALEKILQIRQLQNSGTTGPRLSNLRLDGVVLWQDPKCDRLVLQDETGTEMLRYAEGLPLVVGSRIRLSGPCWVSEGQCLLGPILSVDNDGVHAMLEKSESIYLPAGRYRARVEWFNGANISGLEVYFEGPGLARQKIPDTAWHRRIDGGTAEGAGLTNGLDYECFEGSWRRLPAFDGLRPVKVGTAGNCDLSVVRRTNNVALVFSGFLDIPRNGVYTFSIVSDDGSRLVLFDDKGVKCEVLARVPLPKPNPASSEPLTAMPRQLQWRDIEGIVDALTDTASGLSVHITSGTLELNAQIADTSRILRPLLRKSRIRIAGLAQGVFTPDGEWVEGSLLVPGRDQIAILDVPLAYWSSCLRTDVRALLETALSPEVRSIVRLRGRAQSTAVANQVILEDDTGQIPVALAQAIPGIDGQWCEMLGQLEVDGPNRVFRCEVGRPLLGGGSAGQTFLPVIMSAAQVKRLTREEALRRYPVKCRGVVVSTRYGSGIVLHDATTGVYVLGEIQLDGASPQIGDFLEIEGITDPGTFAPQIIEAKGKRLGTGIMPVPTEPTRDQLLNGSLDAQYVQLQGILSRLQTEDNSLVLVTRAGNLTLRLADSAPEAYRQFEGASIRLRGCLFPQHDETTHQILFGELVVDNVTVLMDEPAPNAPSEVPSKRVADLGLFDAQASGLNRVRITGVLVHQRDGRCFLMDGTNGFKVFPKDSAALKPGDLVEAVGIPELGEASPVLREATVRQMAATNLPPGVSLSATNLLSWAYDATRVRLESRVLNLSTNLSEQCLELQSGQRTFVARLSMKNGRLEAIRPGSVIALTGVYAGQGGNRAEGREIDSFELLLNSPDDVTILQQPPWWTLRHTLAVVGAVAIVLSLAVGWITALRRQVQQRTRELTLEIEEHKRTEAKLEEKTRLLEGEIDERERIEAEKERIHKELVTASRRAGMADVATGVLHNVGNTLNSVNVSATLLAEKLQRSKGASVAKVAALLAEHKADLGAFVTQDEKGRQVPTYLNLLAEGITSEQREMQQELSSLREHVEHIKEIVVAQQQYAQMSGLVERVSLPEVIEDAFKIESSAYQRHAVTLERLFEGVLQISTDKHKVLQILVNLLQNARYACDESGGTDKRVIVRIAKRGENGVAIAVADNGIGISEENLTKVFNHGFTTRKTGHGFDLHSSALAAQELGGRLTARSEGRGKGATFILELPQTPAGSPPASPGPASAPLA